MKKRITYGKGIEGETICFDNDIQVGYYKKNLDGTIYAKSISGQEVLFKDSECAESLAKIFLCTYDNHKKPSKKPPADFDGQYKMNLL